MDKATKQESYRKALLALTFQEGLLKGDEDLANDILTTVPVKDIFEGQNLLITSLVSVLGAVQDVDNMEVTSLLRKSLVARMEASE
jgi:hypothetical protein